MFAARTEITDLKARVEEPTKSEVDFKVRYEEARLHRERVEDRAVVALTVASRAASHRVGYVECTTHVEIAFDTQWGTRHYLVNEQAEEGLCKAEENYDNLSLPVMDLVFEALKHEDYVARLKAIFEPSETVELTD
ncbi:hypothetical protein Hanom_Chr10g00917421 [Helianthus anomalus]